MQYIVSYTNSYISVFGKIGIVGQSNPNFELWNSETLVGDVSCPTEQATPPIRKQWNPGRRCVLPNWASYSSYQETVKPWSEMWLAQLSKLLLLSGNSETLVGDVSCPTEQATPPIRRTIRFY